MCTICPVEVMVAALDQRLLGILVCPVCRGELIHRDRRRVLVCEHCELDYPVRDGIPVMLPDEARRQD